MKKDYGVQAKVPLAVTEGKLKLDDPVSSYIPEMKDQRLTADAPAITVRNLLTHSAGFPEDNPWGDRQLAKTDEEMIAMIKNGISFSNDPGLAYEYSNMGFAMLGYIIKKKNNCSFVFLSLISRQVSHLHSRVRLSLSSAKRNKDGGR